MAVVAIKNPTSVKIKYDYGTNLDGKKIIKSKSYGSIKSSATNEQVMAVVNVISGLQKHTVYSTARVDTTTLAE